MAKSYMQDGKNLHAGWQKPTRRMAKTYTQDGKNLHAAAAAVAKPLQSCLTVRPRR